MPNPANTQFTVRSETIIRKIEINHMFGLWVKKVNGTSLTSITINTLSLKSGTYTCKVIANSGTESLKLLIQR